MNTPIREIDLRKHINDKGKIRRDMNEGIGHDRQLNLNPEDTQDQFAIDSSFNSGANTATSKTLPIDDS